MKDKISSVLQSITGTSDLVTDCISVGGGSINRCYKATCHHHVYFVKVNDARRFPQMFEREISGLDLLRSGSTFRVPKTFGVYADDEDAFLVMEFILRGTEGSDRQLRFADALAALHRNHGSFFGLEEDNYIGSLWQVNKGADDWTSFFINARLLPMFKSAMDSALLNKHDLARLDRLMARLDDFFPAERPSLLHGDLWSGNWMPDESGHPCLFDPAVYYGHRYMDLGMMQLFGGFSTAVFDRYFEHFPPADNWKEGLALANLYPLLVHVNLFGGSYVAQFRAQVSQFS